MRIVAITRILDEADIVEAFIRHTAAHVDHHVFMDNGSKDGTLEIIEGLIGDGFKISVFQNGAVSFNEEEFNTFLYRNAVAEHGADWVICLDADEFIDDRALDIGFRGYFARLDASDPAITCVKLLLVNYFYTRADKADEIIAPRRMTRRVAVSDVPKIVIKGTLAQKGITVERGSHDVTVDGRPVETAILERGLRLAHFPERSPHQQIAKAVRGWAKVLAAGSGFAEAGVSWHYKGAFDLIRTTPHWLLRDATFMEHKNEALDLVDDPIRYAGGALTRTPPIDDAMFAIRGLVGYLDALARQHGRLIDECPEARALVREWNATHQRLR